ncbi:UNVERIFIED_CONTAM: hypothetical protein HDU68_005856 [Siphonaria sp. JEL0065]|nr:hypothetical protein HDU68_005856 [Siphonaria sp. JEL0065]
MEHRSNSAKSGVSGTSGVSPGSTRKSRVAADSRNTSKPSSQESTSSPQVAVKGPRGVNTVAAKMINKRMVLELGVDKRTPMGEYIVEKGGVPLSSQANPSPGPLTYDPKLPPSGFQYSILGKHVTTKLEANPVGPGPSKYNVSENTVVFNDAPHWSLGMKLGEFLKVENENPSPFAYNNIANTFEKGDGPRYTISGWFETPTDSTPSPDRYFPNPSCIPVAGANPKFSFGLKTSFSEEVSPGPQDYDVHFVRSSISDAPCYTMRPRVGEPVFTNKEDALIPGANEYNPKLPGDSKAASLKGWYKESKSLKTPGPANYIIPNSLFSGPQYSLTGRNIPDEEESHATIPGPTSYNPKPLFDKPPEFSLGNRWKPELPKNYGVPGPGAYEPKDRQIRGNGAPKVTLKGRYDKKISRNPGPADYNTANPIERTVSAAQLARLEKSKKEVPQRIRTIVEKSPGPADYDLKPVSTVKPCGPKYSLATRIAPFKSDQTPGPNCYAARKPMDGPKITMKSRSSPFVLVFPSQRVDTLRLGH